MALLVPSVVRMLGGSGMAFGCLLVNGEACVRLALCSRLWKEMRQ